MTDESPARTGAGPALRRMMLIDTLVGVLVNAGVFPLILWLVRLPPPAGPGEGLADAVKATALPVVLMTFIMTLVLRARFRKAPASAADLIGPLTPAFVRAVALRLGAPWKPRSSSAGPFSGVLLRTALFTLLAVIVLAPLRVAVCAALGLYPLSMPGFTLLNVVHGAIIGTLFMPPIILAAMGDASPQAD